MSKSGRFAVLSVALALSFALVDPASAQTTNGLVAYYSMTGNAHDDSSHGNDGNLSASGATLTSDRLGQANSAYQFDAASGGNILVHGSDSLDVGAADGLTIAAWLNPATVLTHRPDRGVGRVAQRACWRPFLAWVLLGQRHMGSEGRSTDCQHR